MRKPDPSRFTGRKANQADELEMKGFSASNEIAKDSNAPLAVKTKDDTTASSHHDAMQPWYHDTVVEEIRKAVKVFGKEAATHRFTVEEKQAIAEIVFKFRQKGIKTSENEIARIAINFILQNFKQKGKDSLLEKVQTALNE